jgi:DNA-binding transcriptional MerR regulator
MGNGFLRIGQVAIACGVSVDTVRHYERRGLLPAASRSEANQRQYSRQAIPRVQLVRRGLQFGFSLKELAAFMQARDTGVPPCRAVRGAAEALLARVDAQLAELTRRRTIMRKTLRAWDMRLANTPENTPARLLEALPLPAPASKRCGVAGRSGPFLEVPTS